MKTFQLPDLGEGLQDAEIVSWHVNVGDRMVADQPLVSVETAKAVVEVPAPWSGTLVKQHGDVGAVIPVGGPLADIETETASTDAASVVGSLPAVPHPAPTVAAQSRSVSADPSIKVAPAVRRRASELGVDLSKLNPTAAGGMITIADVEAAAAGQAGPGNGYEPLGGVRRAMADAMSRHAAKVVPATVSDEAVIDGWSSGSDPTVRLIRAVVAACEAAPALNAWLDADGKSRRLHTTIDLGIAMESEDGLFAPVLRDVAAANDDDLRRRLETMKRDVKARRVPLSELRGQTISLSNFGMFGGLNAVLTVMPPQVAIIGAGRIHSAPRVIDGTIRAARVLPLSLTFDHRAVTGAEAIAFLRAAISDLERP